jgi:hypothetical protein
MSDVMSFYVSTKIRITHNSPHRFPQHAISSHKHTPSAAWHPSPISLARSPRNLAVLGCCARHAATKHSFQNLARVRSRPSHGQATLPKMSSFALTYYPKFPNCAIISSFSPNQACRWLCSPTYICFVALEDRKLCSSFCPTKRLSCSRDSNFLARYARLPFARE